ESKAVRHFYSEAEIAAFRSRWTMQAGCVTTNSGGTSAATGWLGSPLHLFSTRHPEPRGSDTGRSWRRKEKGRRAECQLDAKARRVRDLESLLGRTRDAHVQEKVLQDLHSTIRMDFPGFQSPRYGR